MSDQYVAEIRMFGCNFAPRNWALCNGQLLAISQNTALFALVALTSAATEPATSSFQTCKAAPRWTRGTGRG